MGEEIKILGKITDHELQDAKFIQELITRKSAELNVIRRGFQHTIKELIRKNKFPDQIRLDTKTGIVYNVPQQTEPPMEFIEGGIDEEIVHEISEEQMRNGDGG